MKSYGTFPFGEKVNPVVQSDKSPKDIFILGVYASAVHARWTDKNGNTLVNALAIASEPEIFWRGDNATGIISEIQVPEQLGSLKSAASNLNGPSGRSLDDEYLLPLALTRDDVWLSDIYPFAHMNKGQKKAIEREYLPLMNRFDLPTPTLLPAPTKEPGVKRREEIWDEFEESQAKILVLLGDKPIDWFFKFFIPAFQKLADFSENDEKYGRLHPINIRGRQIEILPLVHPRQASRLGASSKKWHDLHAAWKENTAPGLLI